jgi:hypothetical protein
MWRRFGRPVLTGTEARQGFLGLPVLGILTISLILAVVILGIMWLVFGFSIAS